MTCPLDRCDGTGLLLIEGPCDAAPLDAPCPCLGVERVAVPDRDGPGEKLVSEDES